jgi:hypothetical protein
MNPTPAEQGLAWQIGAWDRMAEPYQREVDRRLAPLVDGVMKRAALRTGERVLDLGTGTGAIAIRAARGSEVGRSMWPNGEGPRRFRNRTQFIVGTFQRVSDRC